MADFPQALNTATGSRLTSAVWDANVAQWMMKSQSYVQTAAGVWTPLVLDANGYLKDSIKDRFDTIKAAPTVGIKTVTTTAAEVFAGASRLASRYMMAVYNEGTSPVFFGPTGVAITLGFPIFPGDSMRFDFIPSVATPIYLIGTVNTSVRVVELA